MRALQQFSSKFAKTEIYYFGYKMKVVVSQDTYVKWKNHSGLLNGLERSYHSVHLKILACTVLVFVPQPCMVHHSSGHRLWTQLLMFSPGKGAALAEDESWNVLAPLLHSHRGPSGLPRGELGRFSSSFLPPVSSLLVLLEHITR